MNFFQKNGTLDENSVLQVRLIFADLNEQAEDMFCRAVKELAEKEGITETLKAENQMLWVQRMNSVRQTATEIVNNDLIYTLVKRQDF